MTRQINLRNKFDDLWLMEPSTLFRKAFVSLNHSWDHDQWAEKRFLVSHSYKFIYCYIPKIASTSFIRLMLEASNSWRRERLLSKEDNLLVRRYVLLNFSLANHTRTAADKILASDYFKFVIVRNPWDRLASAYLQFFVRHFIKWGFSSTLAKQAEASLCNSGNIKDYENEVTFKQFIEHICGIEQDNEMDLHVRPQHTFLAGAKFDYVGRLETIDQDFQYILDRIGLSLSLPERNRSKYVTDSLSIKDYANISSSDLGKLKHGYPGYKEFYTPELIDLVAQRYDRDIKDFDYSFD